MAVLARLLRIPSRVVVGYTAGTRTGPGPAKTGAGNYVVKTSDAHAWPELYFRGLGWLRMEPTPSGTGIGQGTAIPPSYSAATPAAQAESQLSQTSQLNQLKRQGGARQAAGGSATKGGFAEGGLGAAESEDGTAAARPCCCSCWPRCW